MGGVRNALNYGDRWHTLHRRFRRMRNWCVRVRMNCNGFEFQTARTTISRYAVIASEAKQSIGRHKERWIASSLRSSQ
jgi:hypothetical protein